MAIGFAFSCYRCIERARRVASTRRTAGAGLDPECGGVDRNARQAGANLARFVHVHLREVLRSWCIPLTRVQFQIVFSFVLCTKIATIKHNGFLNFLIGYFYRHYNETSQYGLKSDSVAVPKPETKH